MKQKLQLELIKKILKKEGEEGFSLIELVVVVAVLAVLSAIALPSFNCFPKRAKATAALAALRQINTECAYKSAGGEAEIFTSSPLDGYTIQTNGSNSCSGAQGTGVISAVPANTNELPTFNLAAATGSLTYTFKGRTGTNFTECLGMICDKNNSRLMAINRTEFLERIASNSFAVQDTFVQEGCSGYALVEGPTWQQAEANAKKLGGNLATINGSTEHEWIAKEFSKEKYAYEGDTNPGDPDDWLNLWVGGEYDQQSRTWKWSSGQEWGANGFNGIGENDPGLGQGRGTDSFDPSQRSKMLAHFNHRSDQNQHTRHGDGPGTYYWAATTGTSNNTRGIVEVPLCSN